MTTKPVLMLGLLALVGTPLALPEPADAAVVICKKGKKLKLREDACKGAEQQVELSGAGIEVSTLPAVPQATSADTAASADTATTADSATTAEVAQSATSADTCNTAAAAADADTLDGLDSTAFGLPFRWALVATDCLSILSQSGGISIVTEDSSVPGVCILDFGEDLRDRGVVASVRGGISAKGWAQVAVCGAPDGGPQTSNCNVPNAVNAPNELAVATADPDGTFTDRSFYVMVAP